VAAWPALIVSPLLALADQGVAYALVPWACANQVTAPLNAVHAVFFVLAALTAMPAWRAWRTASASVGPEAAPATERMKAIAAAGLMLAALSCLTIAAMWMAHAALSPCFG
jgi:hypothetical protein